MRLNIAAVANLDVFPRLWQQRWCPPRRWKRWRRRSLGWTAARARAAGPMLEAERRVDGAARAASFSGRMAERAILGVRVDAE